MFNPFRRKSPTKPNPQWQTAQATAKRVMWFLILLAWIVFLFVGTTILLFELNWR